MLEEHVEVRADAIEGCAAALEGAEKVEPGGIDAFEVGQVEGEGACGLPAPNRLCGQAHTYVPGEVIGGGWRGEDERGRGVHFCLLLCH